VRYIANKNDWHVFQNEIPFSRSYPKGAREGRPIFWTSYRRKKAQEHMLGFGIELTKKIGL
jgi:chromosome partitioning protein